MHSSMLTLDLEWFKNGREFQFKTFLHKFAALICIRIYLPDLSTHSYLNTRLHA